jgi:hypothetical protein
MIRSSMADIPEENWERAFGKKQERDDWSKEELEEIAKRESIELLHIMRNNAENS